MVSGHRLHKLRECVEAFKLRSSTCAGCGAVDEAATLVEPKTGLFCHKTVDCLSALKAKLAASCSSHGSSSATGDGDDDAPVARPPTDGSVSSDGSDDSDSSDVDDDAGGFTSSDGAATEAGAQAQTAAPSSVAEAKACAAARPTRSTSAHQGSGLVLPALLKVHLLNGSSKLFPVDQLRVRHADAQLTAGHVFEAMAEKIGLERREYALFALFAATDEEATAVSFDVVLPPALRLDDLWAHFDAAVHMLRGTQARDSALPFVPLLYLRARPGLAVDDQRKAASRAALTLLFEETLSAVLTSQVILPKSELITLGALLIQLYYGDHDKKKHLPGFFRAPSLLAELLPRHVLASSSFVSKQAAWEKKMFKAHSKLVGYPPLLAKLAYDEHVRSLAPWLGAVLLPVSVESADPSLGKALAGPLILAVRDDTLFFISTPDPSGLVVSASTAGIRLDRPSASLVLASGEVVTFAPRPINDIVFAFLAQARDAAPRIGADLDLTASTPAHRARSATIAVASPAALCAAIASAIPASYAYL
ncbi:uncharacterized protein AMSG_04343 [Thecamonas trahens ATCC 50062]|uniref:FERM domain-containing protein n=1 Tax=Thecamonas trahens ATCC 50062 TaxID=461836 RepID=A0A0L0DA05_THETB|nr:hypothetical protein AMSG_04343 [Thecamonas trahens ATCC 50062]KNC48113.1 hypothetical protein AMSG_04343 [Thecamonas trahens ATCC 50062]|eukprot:XP_013758686.1 hypothetical protein AMSG_04343 [Thecamonas trahens ATCC 50062]